METKEVYIGNGQTITIYPSEKQVYYLDLDKIEKYFNENPQEEICVGATSDWFFTARTIKGKKEFEDIINHDKCILRASSWSRFSSENGEDYTVEIPKSFDSLSFNNGFSLGKGKIEFWIPNLLKKMRAMKYEQIKEFSEKVKELLKEYDSEQNLQAVDKILREGKK